MPCAFSARLDTVRRLAVAALLADAVAAAAKATQSVADDTRTTRIGTRRALQACLGNS
jgi:hypothetical protein